MTINFEEITEKTFEVIEEKYNNRNKEFCGFPQLDEILHGFLNSQLTILAARPSMGKTSLALNMAVNFAKNDRKVLFISCEMGDEILMQRIIASESEVHLNKLLGGDLSPDEWERIANFANKKDYKKLNENIELSASFCEKFDKLSENINIFAKENPNSIVIIDYFQLLNRQGQAQERYVELADLASSIKRLAVENNIHIILLSQLSRKIEERTDKTPLISDLSECDALAQHADNILFLHRDEYWDKENLDCKNKAKIIAAKLKNSSPQEIKLLFFGQTTKFKNPFKFQEI